MQNIEYSLLAYRASGLIKILPGAGFWTGFGAHSEGIRPEVWPTRAPPEVGLSSESAFEEMCYHTRTN